MIFVLPAISLAIGGWLGHRLGRARRWGWWMLLVLVTIALFAAIFLWLRMAADTRAGFDGVGQAVLAVLGLLPLELGLLTGAGVAALRNRRSPTAP